MCRIGGDTRHMLAGVSRHQALPEVHLDQRVTGMPFQPFPNVLMRYRVVMVLILNVVVDVHLDRLAVAVRS